MTPRVQISTHQSIDAGFENKKRKHSTLQHAREELTTHATRDILLFLIAFRILNALSVSTFFQPDEYFQSLEPAWQIAFGEDSGAWITWVRPKLLFR